MNKIIVRKVNNCMDYNYVVYPTTYINPLAKPSTLNMQLKEQNVDAGFILFDLLLCNGENFNRFAKAYYDGTKIVSSSIELVDITDEEVQIVEQYYAQNKSALKKGVLVPSEYLLHC